MQQIDNKLWAVVEPVVTGLGYELVGMEHVKQGRFSVLRVYADKPDGINLDECAQISHQLSTVFDVEETITGSYNLEVSSPGVDRPIFRAEDLPTYLNEQLNVRLNMPIEGRRKYKGELLRVENDFIVLLVDKKEIEIPLDSIDKANLIANINFKNNGS